MLLNLKYNILWHLFVNFLFWGKFRTILTTYTAKSPVLIHMSPSYRVLKVTEAVLKLMRWLIDDWVMIDHQ